MGAPGTDRPRQPEPPGVAIRELSGMPELRAAVAFQEEIWGPGFSERVPVSLMKVSARLGGVVAGAFLSEGDEPPRMVGFVYGMTGLRDGEVVHWSDMLAVAPDLRDMGLGRRLKWYQRDQVLSRGVRRMYWTCDPLEARNLAVNLNHLGASAAEYVRDMYGVSDSPLHRGLGTDRFVIRWDLDSPEVEARASGGSGPDAPGRPPAPDLPRAFQVDDSPTGLPAPGPPARERPPTGLRVPVPSSIQRLRDADPQLAQRWRAATRQALEPTLAEGWVVHALERGDTVSHLILRPPIPKFP